MAGEWINMAELNLKQIIDRLNAEFAGDTRKLVFWYDDKAEFEEDMQGVRLENAKVYYLQRDNQFYTKYFLERVDTATNYLIYAPFPKPETADNHLEDTLLYSKRFFADRAALLLADLGIDEKYRPLIEKHIKFWAEKKRAQRFYDLEIENYNETNILVGIMAALCFARTYSFEDVVRVVLTGGGLADNSFLAEFERYDLLDAFWKLCEQHFGYTDVKPTLEKLIVAMFVTYTAKYIGAELPKPWKMLQSYKSGNIIAFLDNLMNSVIYRETYDALSAHVAKSLNAGTVFAGYLPEDLLGCDTFLCIDQIIIKWMTDRLLNEDIGAKLGTLTIPQVCEKRQKMHFGPQMEQSYSLLDSAYHLITAAAYHCPDGFKAIVDTYRNTDCQIDSAYRRFYFAYDQLADAADFETLRELAENIYTNEFLAKLLPKWNAGLVDGDSLTSIPAQVDFFSRHIKNAKDRVVVIISDALRFEVGRELFQRMQDAPKCVSAKLEIQLGVLPSYTRLGMAALLPHKSLAMTDDYQVLVDDVLCDSLAGREKVLQSYVPGSVCVQFDDMKALKKMELREIITGKQVVYIYHNQIDARGDKLNTENEVFSACQEAIQEIIDLIHRIAVGANTIHFIVTADHGFIYKRDKVTESGKIGGVSDKGAFVNRRFIVSSAPVVDNGIANMSMGTVLRNNDPKVVSFPVSSNVFKVAGGGQNYVHGGSSPQEMLVPVIDIRMEKGHIKTKNAEIALVSMIQKITNKITILEFIQSEPVSDTVKATTYKMFFVSEDNERVSNEVSLFADSRDPDALKRMFRMKFQFKDKRYDRDKQYFLVVYDDNTGLEVFRHPMLMDLAFADDFGFGI
jgi:uncharacterized protein (TIGR02687 family)